MGSEIQKESYLKTSSFQVVNELGLFSGLELFERFKFDDDFLIGDQISIVALIEAFARVGYAKRVLRGEWDLIGVRVLVRKPLDK